VKVEIGDATLYLGDCMDILPTLGKVDAVITDPPYGMSWFQVSPDKTKHRNAGGRRTGGGFSKHAGESIHGDFEAFDPSHLLTHGRRQVIFGMNHFSDKLPKGGVLVWIKKAAHCWGAFLSDAEIAWISGREGVMCFNDFSTGQADARLGLRGHPNQKPTSVMRWVIEMCGGDGLVLDPYMGSGATGMACIQLGRKFIGIEREPKYFDIACKRIEQAVSQGQLFAPVAPKAEQLEIGA
jgi:hypothetical protein